MGGGVMLVLRTRNVALHNPPAEGGRQVARMATDPCRPFPLRHNEVFLVTESAVPDGYCAYAIFADSELGVVSANVPTIVLPPDLSYLDHGDVVTIDWGRPAIEVLYRRKSPSNSFLVTERCNHLCLMCSQPPRDINDSWLIDEILAAIPLIDPATRELGFTGGEPTSLGSKLLTVILTAKNYLPRTSLHLLSHGRRFANEEFVSAYAEVGHPDIMVGIPIYSDVSTIHDYVVQSDGAFDETIRGILNLKRFRQKVEVRVVIHKQTYARLPRLAEFLARNLTMVDHVALMGLEITGFTRANLPDLWIDPWDYRSELYDAVTILADHRMNVSVYNHQLCVIDRRIWPYARRSISDWKNEYMPECNGCDRRQDCGGFFSSAKHRYSDHIAPLRELGGQGHSKHAYTS
jgi:His-Xaa-Ser system radical SAM maturase HxsC